LKTLRNRTQKPIRVPLPGGKVLHLGPAKTGQVADDAVDRPALRKLLDAGDVEIVGGSGQAAAGSSESSPVPGSTHGHKQTTVVKPSGNR